MATPQQEELPSDHAAKCDLPSEFECPLCFKMLFQPVTTPCGHSFCRSCLARSYDHTCKCPTCRSIFHMDFTHAPITITLQAITKSLYPKIYEEREREVSNETQFATHTTPLFPIAIMMPQERTRLHIFEPRYRLMTRRILAGNKRLTILVENDTAPLGFGVGCECEVTNYQALADGRFLLEIVGIHRVRVVADVTNIDGYLTAQVEPLHDDPVDPDDEPALRQSLADLVAAVDQAKSKVQSDVLQAMEKFPAPAATPEKAEEYTFWVASWFLGGSHMAGARKELLEVVNTKDRTDRLVSHVTSAASCITM